MTGTVELSSPLSLLERGFTTPGETVKQHFDRLDVKDSPVVCLLNGEPFLRKYWDKTVTIFDSLQFVSLPLGGDFKKIISAVAAIALAVVAPYAAPLIGAAIGVTSAIGISIITAGIIIGGNLLINALLPPSVPGGQAQETFNSSPTYSLTAQGNQARLLQPIPRLYGRHILFPDFASQPYSSYEGNDQFLYQLFSLGVGEYNVEEIRIEDTKMWDQVNGFSDSFSDVEIEIIQPGQPLTLFPAAVTTSIEVGGQELLKFNSVRPVSFDGNRITFTGNGDEKLQNIAVGDNLQISGSSSNDGNYVVTQVDSDDNWVEVSSVLTTTSSENVTIETESVIGPFIANPADKNVDKLAVDFILPRGLYFANNSGGLNSFNVSVKVEAREVDSFGDPLTSWSTIGLHDYVRETSTPQRITEFYDVSLGRYEVRVSRTTNKESGSRYGNDLVWGGLRAFTPDDNSFDDVTLLAVKIRASNQLTDSSSRRFNVIQSSKLEVWDGETWSEPTVTSNPAWVAADILRNNVYGANLSDDRIDLKALLTLAQTWSSRNDQFNGIFDTKRSVWDALSAVLRVGRAQPLMIAGKVSFVRDEQAQLVRGMLTPQNIKKGSFETTHVLYDENTPDSVVVEFLDERTWKQNEVSCFFDDQVENPSRIKIFGITDRTQAWREGIYQAAVNLYRRLFASLSLEMEGRMLIRGDTVVVSHDMPQWGCSAEVLNWDEALNLLTVSEPLKGSVAAFNDSRNQLWGPVEIESISNDGLQITLKENSVSEAVMNFGEIPISTSTERELTRISTGDLSTYSKRFKIVSTRADSLTNVSVVLTHDDQRVYEADLGSPPVEQDLSSLEPSVNAPQLTGLIVNQNQGSQSNPVTLDVSWQPTPFATNYIVQSSTDGVTWRTVFSGEDSLTQFTEQAGNVYVRAAAIGLLRGPWVYTDPSFKTYGVPNETPQSPPNLSVLANVADGVIEVSWSAAQRAETYEVELFVEDQTTGVYETLALAKSVNGTFAQFTQSVITAQGGPWSSFEVVVKGVNETGVGSPSSLIVNNVFLPPVSNISLVSPYVGSEINLDWLGIQSATSYFVEIIENSIVVGSYRVSNPVLLISSQEIEAMGGPWRSLSVSVKAESGSLESGATTLLIEDLAPPVVQNITTSSNTTGQVDISWDEITGDQTLTGYKVHLSEVDGFVPGDSNEVYDGQGTTVSVTGLTQGTTVYIVVVAIDSYAGQNSYNYSSQVQQVVS